MVKYRVISFDGGGIRGLVTTILLQRIAATPGLERFLDSASLLAGTSTGGLMAMGIAQGLELQRIRDLYVIKGPKIFDDSRLDNLFDLGRLVGAQYDTEPLRHELQQLFEDTTLGKLERQVLITSFDLDNEAPKAEKRTWKPKLFHNFKGPDNDRARLAVEVGLYTCAAPSYFPSVDGFIDGGVFANNPSMCALAQTQDARYKPTPPLDQVVLLSLGTGTSLRCIKGQVNDWGAAQWAKPLINLMLDGTAGIAHYQCDKILGDRYHRLAPTFPPGEVVDLDDHSKIEHLIDFANTVSIDDTVAWIKREWVGD